MEKQKKIAVKSSTLKCGRRTYFFDVQTASNNKNYLKITESQFTGEGENRKRNSFILFPEDIKGFGENLKEMTGSLAQ